MNKQIFEIFFSFNHNTVNIDSYNPHEQKLFGILTNHERHKRILRPKSLRTAVLDCLISLGTWIHNTEGSYKCKDWDSGSHGE